MARVEREDKVDLGTLMIPRHHANVLDVFSQASGRPRTDLVRDLIAKYVAERDHEQSLYRKIVRSNSNDSDD